MPRCTLCPRKCGAVRENGEIGACHTGREIVVALAAPHHFEEPPISGQKGSGAVFFGGCSLGCIFCQNQEISREAKGRAMTEDELGNLLLSLAEQGVHNLNLVTGTHYTDRIARVLKKIKPHLSIPVIWNSSGYENPDTLRLLEGLIDIYLPDYKYVSRDLSAALSGAPDYRETADQALLEMYRQVGPVRLGEDGMLKRGMVVRHLALPGCRRDTEAVLHALRDLLPTSDILLSLMRQYTPDFAPPTAPKHLLRRLTSFEYDAATALAAELGFRGFTQGKDAASRSFTPDFS
ncbi:MAG: radical SAM protein [Clostridia bacterium]|nr:radical SAM protein [Clostridia bacterium]